MATPFSVRSNQDPMRAAALDMLRQGQAPPEAAPQQQEAAPGMNPVADLLAQAASLILQRGGLEEDLMAVQQFLGFLEQIASGAGVQAANAPAMANQAGPAPMMQPTMGSAPLA